MKIRIAAAAAALAMLGVGGCAGAGEDPSYKPKDLTGYVNDLPDGTQTADDSGTSAIDCARLTLRAQKLEEQYRKITKNYEADPSSKAEARYEAAEQKLADDEATYC